MVVRRDPVGDVFIWRSTVRQHERLAGLHVHTGRLSFAAAAFVSQEHVQNYDTVLGVAGGQTTHIPRAQSIFPKRQRLSKNTAHSQSISIENTTTLIKYKFFIYSFLSRL